MHGYRVTYSEVPVVGSGIQWLNAESSTSYIDTSMYNLIGLTATEGYSSGFQLATPKWPK